MQIIDNRALLLRVRRPKQITNIIPKSKQVGKHEVLVSWGLEEARVLHNLGIKDVPSPILGRYDWTGMYKPFDHQRTTAAFLTMNPRSFCFSDPGTGKTASVIWAADYLMKLGIIKRVLIVCPMSIMRTAWLDDLFTVAMHRTAIIAHNTDRRKRAKAVQSGAEFVIINYDGLGIVKDEVIAGEFDLVVADEATALKTTTTDRWKTFKSVLKPDTKLWLLTGTPAAQRPTDAYGLAKLVCPERVPRFFSSFRDRVMTKVTQFKWAPKPDAEQIVFDALQPAIRFTKEECLDLPPVMYLTREAPMSRQQFKYYEQIRKSMRVVADGEEVTAVNVAAQLNKLLQIATGTVYTDTGEVLEFDASGRLNVLLEAIEQASHKVVVFVPFRHAIFRVQDFLTSKGYSNEAIYGDVSSGKRNMIFSDFQNKPDPHILVIQPQAAAHGVTLTAADTVVWYAPTTSVELYLQGNARTDRAGQLHKGTVIRLQGSSVEKRMYKMLEGNLDQHEQLIDLYRSVIDED